MESIQSPIEKHKGHKHMLVRGDFGPHRAKMICIDCEGAFVKWERINKNTYEYRKGVKYQCVYRERKAIPKKLKKF